MEVNPEYSNQKILYSDLIIEDAMIGTGFTSTIYKCKIKGESSQKIFALKSVKSPRDIKNLRQEINILQQVPKHPNIIQIQKFSSNFLVLKHYQNGDLFQYIQNSNKQFPKIYSDFYAKQLVKAISHLHLNKIAHLDIKLENILLSDNFQRIKLIDFGFSQSQYDMITEKQKKDIDGAFRHIQFKSSQFAGTEVYQSPSITAQKVHDPFASDIFSLGVLIFILYTGQPPFKNSDNKGFYKLFKEDNKRYWEIMDKRYKISLGQEFQNLIIGCMEYDEEKRLKIQDIIDHPFFKNQEIVDDLEEYKDAGFCGNSIENHQSNIKLIQLQDYMNSLKQ